MIRLPRKSSGPKPPKQPLGLLGFARGDDIRALFELLGMVATSKGWIPNPEINEIERFMGAHIPASEREFAISCFIKGTHVSKMREAVTKRAFQLYGFRDCGEPDRWLEPIQVLDILLRVALADGTFSILEEHIIDYTRQTLGVHSRAYWVVRDTLAERFGVEIPREGASFKDGAASTKTSRKREQASPVGSTLSRTEALSRLGLTPEATAAEIKAHYRSLVKECHPDLVQAKGDEGSIKAAALRFCELQEAYEQLSQ
jgi:hypothetical protein